MEIKIRKTKESDTQQIAAILEQAFQVAYANKIPDKVIRQNIDNQIKVYRRKNFNANGSIDYVAVDANNVVAFIIGKTPEASSLEHYSVRGYAELMSISISPEYQHKGLGKMLFEFVVCEFKKRGCTKMVIGTLKDNLQARKAYEKWGCILDTTYEKSFEMYGHSFTEVFYLYDPFPRI